MSKHMNKYWLKEKEYISLLAEYDFLYKSSLKFRRRVIYSTRLMEIDKILYYKFYNEYCGRRYSSVPKWYKKMLNHRQRYRSKRSTNLAIFNDNYYFDDNYKSSSSWY